MSFSSVERMLRASEESGLPLWQVIREDDCRENGYSADTSHRRIAAMWDAMLAASRDYREGDRSHSGLSGGDAGCVRRAADAGELLGGTYMLRVTEEALKIAECNACMKRIVAAPTAGSCGVLPAVLIPLAESGRAETESVLEALYIAAGFGQITAERANVSGAEGGCQAEIGTASAMAAAALTYLLGGSARRCAHAFALALGNLLGLVCDPVAGLVEIPCIRRNVTGALNAVGAANMAVAGLESRIPPDEVIDAMGEIGAALPAALRETGLGGLAATPTARRITEEVRGGGRNFSKNG